MRYIYGHSFVICAHGVIGTCGIYVAFEGHTCSWYIFGNSIVNRSCFLSFYVKFVCRL